MPKKTETNYSLQIKRRMEALGVYKPQYDMAIANLARIQKQYDELDRRFEDEGYPFEVETAQGTKKAPIVTTLESLRKDILSYMSALGLTPQGAKRLELPTQKAGEDDPLAAALKSLGA